jgi:hypothetical protein
MDTTLPVIPPTPGDIPVSAPSGGVGSTAKETEGTIGMTQNESFPLTEIGKDIDLPKEVVAAGVSFQPTVVTIPPKVSQMGVAPAGQNITVSSGATVSLPLTDDQIELGLKQNVTSSWRWLAVWCVRKLKKLHIVLKKIGGKTVEVSDLSKSN